MRELLRVHGGRRREGGFTYGETDDFGYNIVKDPVHIHDLNATILHIMGIDHVKLTCWSRVATSGSPTSTATW